MAQILFIGASCGAFGFLMENVLIKPGEVFAFVRRIGDKYLRTDGYLQKVLYACGKCCGGNLALWYYLLEFDPIRGFAAAVWAILIALFLKKLYVEY